MINNRFVLTAGHCVCLQSNNTKVPCENNKLRYNPKEVLRVAVMVGFGNPENLFNIDQVIKHKQWDGTWSSFPGKHLILILH